MDRNLQSLDDTIAAIATPVGEAGLAVLRVSGKDAFGIVDKCFDPIGKSSSKPSKANSHTIQYGRILQAGRVVDEVMVSVFRAPRTFTREHVVEISTHGGSLPAKLVLDTLLHHGARLAEPGEFTMRAFLNGRIDLTQAEAVADVIHSRTELALNAANEQLAGKLSAKIRELRTQLMSILAHLEAHIDFPDEDIAPDTKDQMIQRIQETYQFMDALLSTANEGRILRRGIKAAIVGRPNAGKSSLLNHLLGHERAIVSHEEGTTRDTIEETANIRGVPIIFVDTAGLREANNVIEQEGIRRSRRSIEQAELVLHVVDGTAPLHTEDLAFLDKQSLKSCLHVLNKSDLEPHHSHAAEDRHPWIPVSCSTGSGMESLKDAIIKEVWSGNIKAEMLEVMINSRHQDALLRSKSSLETVIEGLKNDIGLELIAMDLRIAVGAVGEIVGETTTENLLDSIFSQFCLGK
ncbi:MAG: tRNA uridine-5-carboxymethylaminomethyl(34) synthesis GTPase MnmE [Verrucomicrobia bacterium]|jgi:tRNA modification GTPase|nr:tRNA uridine-5-carboxymethylaminomethyl(34) synthesis GTPase MnmE [Verrucomicrobiota bacterium]